MNIPNISIKQLLESGVHLGHKTLRWNPKMEKFIFGEKNSIHIIDLTKTVSYIPVQKLLVETDSPYLAPLPYRGKSNEPSYIIHTVEKLSQIKNLSNRNIIDHTTKNFKKLFSFK